MNDVFACKITKVQKKMRLLFSFIGEKFAKVILFVIWSFGLKSCISCRQVCPGRVCDFSHRRAARGPCGKPFG